MNKINVCIIFGGQSAEHEISIKSAKNIFYYINKKIFNVYLIWISKKGFWYFIENKTFLSKKFNDFKNNISLVINNKYPIVITKTNLPIKIDVIFPIIHGKFGEDGKLQGLLNFINIPFVGSDVLSSSVSMDKDFTKRILCADNIPIIPFFTLNKKNYNNINYKNIVDKLNLPFFVKPSNQGSSIGVNEINNQKEFNKFIELAFDFDNKIILEKKIIGKEIECGVLGNDTLKSSICGEILLSNKFYDYKSKYFHDTKIIIPAKISTEISKKIRSLSLKIFKKLECKGMARVDFFLTKNNNIIFNEINTLPGFTKNSMYPKLWLAMKISYSSLITKLINLAIDFHKKKN